MEWMLMPLKRYAEFSGRSRRKEYWMYVLGLWLAIIVATIIDSALGLKGFVLGVYGPLAAVILLGSIVPSIAVLVRRLHDQDKTGWLALFGLVPIANIVLLVFMFLEGTRGPNKYGPDPKDPAGVAAFT